MKKRPKVGGKCLTCGYVFKSKDGPYWKKATICEKCIDDLVAKQEDGSTIYFKMVDETRKLNYGS